MFGMGPPELLIVGVIAVLLFGKKLPEVARSMGKSMTEFKKGMRGIEDEVHSATHAASSNSALNHHQHDYEEASAPKFEPPTSAPQAEAEQPSEAAADQHSEEKETAEK